jgi:phosphonate transport system substrate-binding protein
VWLAARRPAPVEPLAAPVLAGARYGGRPVYFSDVIVRQDSPARTLADLRGCVWAYNDRASHSGWSVVLYELARRGLDLGFFGRVVEAGFHERAMRLVAAGEVDAAAIDSQVLAVALRDDPDLAGRLRVVARFGPSPIQPVVAATRLPAPVRAAARETLCALGEDASARAGLAHGFVERFVPVDDAAYDRIREMLATIRAAGMAA